MTPEIRAFVEIYSIKKAPPITVQEFIKEHNHEIWRKCLSCKNEFDARKELRYDVCPKCGSKNIE